jgi:putative ABC transport system permease protein
MFLRLLMESFLRQRRRKTLAGIAILLGTTAVTAMLALATSIGDRIHRELAVYGANIVVTPKADTLDVKVGGIDLKPATGGAYLKESDLEKLHGIFWANNITGVSPEFDFPPGGTLIAEGQFHPIQVPAVAMWFNHRFGEMQTGAPQLHPWWKVDGAYPTGAYVGPHRIPVLLGARLAEKINRGIGDGIGYEPPAGISYRIPYGEGFEVVGLLHTGDETENKLIVPLGTYAAAQGDITRIEISAKTRPEDAFARVDPDTLSPAKRDLWYCRPYANSIAYQIREAIPGADAQQVRRVEQTEGTVLERISGLMWLISGAALLAAGFAVSAAMATAVLERRGEIGLMRSLGASKAAIATLFYAESGLLAVFAGTIGYVAGSALAWALGRHIFPADGAGSMLNFVLLPVVVAMALVVAIAGSTPSIRAALRTDPAATLRGGE